MANIFMCYTYLFPLKYMQHVKGYISFTGMHVVDASDYHTLIIGECDVRKHVKLICKFDSAIT